MSSISIAGFHPGTLFPLFVCAHQIENPSLKKKKPRSRTSHGRAPPAPALLLGRAPPPRRKGDLGNAMSAAVVVVVTSSGSRRRGLTVAGGRPRAG
ncbi:hypothetical protein GQ55_7G244300 [Panicum hallii var. hallii]|uniref:Uncharacterized protein n=1 Tax=Panicum hallii var. hallii TaxID=1504633 RepID=A0A2T7CYN1_9POAL|nr:hypothetical protein GQ55_7G244300 [Panicum hallii var. hallii]